MQKEPLEVLRGLEDKMMTIKVIQTQILLEGETTGML
jgi:hypothetical protein